MPNYAKPDNDPVDLRKPYFVGMPEQADLEAHPPEFHWEEPVDPPLKRTPLYQTHLDLGARMTPFAGWEMPLWYSSVLQEHLATRQAGGLFDVTHMGVFLAEGPDAAVFLDAVCGNDVLFRRIGESVYTHFMDPDANVIDDLLIYRLAAENTFWSSTQPTKTKTGHGSTRLRKAKSWSIGNVLTYPFSVAM